MRSRTLSQEIEHEMKLAKQRAKKKPPREDTEQMSFVAWARTQPWIDLVWHVPNERKGKVARLYQWAMGVEPGIPDIHIFARGKRLVIEFKRRGEKPSSAQCRVLDIFGRYGYSQTVAYSDQEARRFVLSFCDHES